jgi:hypothetical protein
MNHITNKEYVIDGNGHTIIVEKANRGYEDDYKVTFYEDGKRLGDEYGNKDYIEYNFDVKIDF